MIDKATIAKNFSRAADTYHSHALMQDFAAEQLVKFIDDVQTRPIRSIYEVGCGTGKLTKQLYHRFPNASLTASDISPPMLDQCQENLAGIDTTQFNVALADGEDLKLDQDVDLIASGLTIQWLDLSQCLQQWWPQTNAIAFSTLVKGSLESWFTAVDTIAQTSARPKRTLTLLTEDKIQAACEQLSPATIDIQTATWSQDFETVIDFLRSLKRIGAHTAADNRIDAGSVRRAIRQFENGSGFTANYKIALCVVSKEAN